MSFLLRTYLATSLATKLLLLEVPLDYWSTSVGKKYAMFEPIHGSYPQATGKGIANPVASILSAAMLLDHFDLKEEADMIRKAEICTLHFTDYYTRFKSKIR